MLLYDLSEVMFSRFHPLPFWNLFDEEILIPIFFLFNVVVSSFRNHKNNGYHYGFFSF